MGAQDMLSAMATSEERLRTRFESLGRQVGELRRNVHSLISALERYDLVPKLQPHSNFLGVAPGAFEAAVPAGFGGEEKVEESEEESEYEEGAYLFDGEGEDSEYDDDDGDGDEELGDLEEHELDELIW